MEKTRTGPLDLFALGKRASARKFLKQVHRRHPKKNLDENDCENEE